ncbi:MAG: MinD/ParA family ATP-binding protein, partial [Syntrophaceae bacterium]
DYLGPICRDEAVPRSILRQEPLVLAEPGSKTAACFDRIAWAVSRWGKPLPRGQSAPGPEPIARGVLH